MSKRPKFILLMPILGLAVLAGASVDLLYRPRPGDATRYHQQVREAAAYIPDAVGLWSWNQQFKPDDPGAIKLLRPNILTERQYREAGTNRQFNFLMDQCPDARNMLGHYPPVCYVGQGLELNGQQPVILHVQGDVDEISIPAMAYLFSDKTRNARTLIVNFMILPSGRYVTSMDDVESAAASFAQRFYGAAQVQFVFAVPPDITDAQLDDIRQEDCRIVETFLAPMSKLLLIIYNGGRS